MLYASDLQGDALQFVCQLARRMGSVGVLARQPRSEAGNTDGHGSSDLLDNDVGMVEGGSVGSDVVWVARENLGGTVKRGCYDD
jgi:hypothetical protein